MNKSLIGGGVVLALAIWYFADSGPRVVDFPTGGRNIVAFGDSLVVGYGASAGNDFVSILASRLGRPILNAGKNGDTTATGLERLEEDLLSQEPRIVLLLLGGNDALRRHPVEQTFSRLGAMIDQINQKGAAVILIGVRGSLLGDSYESEFESLAEAKRVNYVPDILSGIFGHPSLMADAIHPNDEGNRLMADRLEPVLRQLLE
ncbi:MAG: GDSL-type esterase/lipase family protein [Fidelibacterota bacterium]